jgi:hypothetical protein
MDWDKLKVFHAAAEAGSFTHAGEQLGLSQSAVSRQVSALEQEAEAALGATDGLVGQAVQAVLIDGAGTAVRADPVAGHDVEM